MGARDLLGRPCVKKGRYSARWRVVQLSIGGSGGVSELIYSTLTAGGTGGGGVGGLPTPVTPGGTAATPGGTGRVNSRRCH